MNDYLARRDAQWMGPVYHSSACRSASSPTTRRYIFDPDLPDDRRAADHLPPGRPAREAYAADITYGTNNEFGFDYLRDNMVIELDELVQRERTSRSSTRSTTS